LIEFQLITSALDLSLYHQTNTSISFLCRQELNSRSFIQPSETLTVKLRDGNGRGGFEGWGLRPRPAWFCLTLSPPHPAYGKNFLSPSPPLGAPRSPAPPRNTLLLVNLLATILIVFNKTCFVNKNILEIKNKFIPSN